MMVANKQRSQAMLAPRDSVVEYIGPAKGYGAMIRLQCADCGALGSKTEFIFGHVDLTTVPKGIGVGDNIPEGTYLGKYTNIGKSTGAHLHFEVIRNNVPINPESTPYLQHALPGYSRSSAFGMRTDPITGQLGKMHYGTDAVGHWM